MVTEELHIIKIVTRFQHAGLKFNIEVSKHDTQSTFTLFAAELTIILLLYEEMEQLEI